jgi:hypothetical protein
VPVAVPDCVNSVGVPVIVALREDVDDRVVVKLGVPVEVCEAVPLVVFVTVLVTVALRVPVRVIDAVFVGVFVAGMDPDGVVDAVPDIVCVKVPV